MASAAPRVKQILERSLAFEYYRGSVNSGCPNGTWQQNPYTLIGQIVDGTIWLQPEGKAPEEIPPQGGYVIPVGMRHRITAKTSRLLTFRWAHVNYSILGSVELLSLVGVPPAVPPRVGRTIGRINLALAALRETSDQHPFQIIAKRKLLGFRLLSLILDNAGLKADTPLLSTSASRLLGVLRYMQEKMDQPITREELANLVHLSPSRFHTVFKQTLGQAPLEYLQTLRVRQAQLRLMETDWPVAEIGRRTGFADPFHFSRQFKKACGESPSAYRQKSQDYLRNLLGE